MKISVCCFVSALLILALIDVSAKESVSNDAKGVRPSTSSLQNTELTEAEILEAWGWLAAQQTEVSQSELNSSELAAFQRGMEACLQGRQSSSDLRAISPDVEKLSLNRREKFWRAIEETNLAAGRDFMSKLSGRNLNKLADGSQLELLHPGTGPFPKPEQTVTVHYVGRLVDGSDFTELGPYDLVLVKNRLLPALFEGIQKINKGGSIRLYVPPVIPGSAETRPCVPRGATTVYDVELLDIKPTPPDELANSLLPPAPEPPPPAVSGASDEQIFEAWGWVTARKTGAKELGFSEDQAALFISGVISAVKGEACKFEENKIRSTVEKYVRNRRQVARLALRQKRVEAMNAVFAELKKNPKIVELPDGLRFEIIKLGEGQKPKVGQIAIVEYTGRLVDGTVFDQTYNEPLHIEIGSVIPGLSEGIQQIAKGGRIRLYVPPSIGYGDEDVSGVVTRIPASSRTSKTTAR